MFEIVKSRHVAQKSDFPVITINKKYVRFNLSCTNLIIKEWGLHPEKHVKLRDYPKLKASNLVEII